MPQGKSSRYDSNSISRQRHRGLCICICKVAGNIYSEFMPMTPVGGMSPALCDTFKVRAADPEFCGDSGGREAGGDQ